MGQGFAVHEAEQRAPGGQVRGTVLMLPGFAYTCRMSLLAWSTRALQAAGWRVLQAQWFPSSVPDDPRPFVEDVAAALDDVPRPSGPVLVVAKSLGTLAAHWAADCGYPAVWFTPVLRPGGLRPMPHESEALAERLHTYPAANLVVGGSADPLWRNGFHGSDQVLEVRDGDHSLEVPDWRAAMQDQERVVTRVATFARDLLSS